MSIRFIAVAPPVTGDKKSQRRQPIQTSQSVPGGSQIAQLVTAPGTRLLLLRREHRECSAEKSSMRAQFFFIFLNEGGEKERLLRRKSKWQGWPGSFYAADSKGFLKPIRGNQRRWYENTPQGQPCTGSSK
jgi:hypothetical protein